MLCLLPCWRSGLAGLPSAMPYLTKDMTLDEAEHEMRHFRMPDLDGRRRYVVETGKVEACLTLMEHGYELDRTEPYLCLSRPTDNGFGTTWGVEFRP